MKRIDTSVSSFEKLRSRGALYVDKTQYLYRLVSGELGDYIFCSRPRRFGKSLLCSTLHCLFQGRRDLFEGLYVAEETDYDFRKYPVLHLDFSQLSTESHAEFKRQLQVAIRRQARLNGVDLEMTSPNMMVDNYADMAGEPLAIIIDEFDSPVVGSLDRPETLKAIQEELTTLFKKIKGINGSVRFFFMTGVTKLSGLNIFPAMNNLNDITMLGGWAGMFGYTQEELEANFARHIDAFLASPANSFASRGDFLSELQDYYDGYRFSPYSDTRVYNPVSVGNFFVDMEGFKNYWADTGGATTLAMGLAREKNLLEVVGDGVESDPSAFRTFEVSALAGGGGGVSRETAVALLYYTGYLTYADGYGTDWMRLPNREVASTFTGDLAARYTNGPYASFGRDARKAVEAGDTEALLAVARRYADQFTYPNKWTEDWWHVVFQSLFLSSGLRVSSEERTLRGRLDLAVRGRKHVYVMEFKYKGSAEEALAQIREKGYHGKYLGNGRTIHLLGVNVPDGNSELEWSEEVIPD